MLTLPASPPPWMVLLSFPPWWWCGRGSRCPARAPDSGAAECAHCPPARRPGARQRAPCPAGEAPGPPPGSPWEGPAAPGGAPGTPGRAVSDCSRSSTPRECIGSEPPGT
uniref:Putative secreted protein n=1 Tax=Ixodes ricinus TaxID=34613 RepID=A0A6B0UIU9_IXORI